jgi:hypothetical protein
MECFLKYPAKINYTKQLFQNSGKNWQEDLLQFVFFVKTMNNHGCSAFFLKEITS